MTDTKISSEKLIEPEEYTLEIKEEIQKIKYRMRNTLTEFVDDDIKVFEYEGSFFILANPILGEEPIFDELGRFLEMVPMRNITAITSKDWVKTFSNKNGLTFQLEVPRFRILRPDLCAKIVK